MFKFSYNSYHKIITAAILITWAIFHFTDSDDTTRYYANGQIKKTGDISNEKNHGRWIWYYENGTKKMEGTFRYGKRTGLWTIWDRAGNKLSEGEYANDKLNGNFRRWNVKGKMIEHLIYQDDVVARWLKVE